MGDKTSSKENAKKQAPKWAMEPFKYFLNQTEYLSQILFLTIKGISVLRAMPQTVKAVAMAEDMQNDTDYENKLAEAEKSAKLAQMEIDREFPIVHAQAIVSLWSFLEALIHSFIVEWVRNNPQAFKFNEIHKLRIRLGEYEQLRDYERYNYIVELLEKDIAIGLRNGTTRFEALLKPFGLSGEIPENIRRDIYELGQVRNIIVHRAGVVDRELLDACPWLDLAFGDEIRVSHKMFKNYVIATHQYVTLIICRVGEYFDVDMNDHREQVLKNSTKT